MRASAGLVLWCGLCLTIGVTGSVATSSSLTDWYPALSKPPWTPPDWIFAPVWTLLYILMGTSAWLVWKPQGFAAARTPLGLFLIQLTLNAAWSWLFFGLRNPMAGLLDIALLWVAIIATILSFYRYNPRAAWLMLPYLAWVSYAAALNFAIFRLNRNI